MSFTDEELSRLRYSVSDDYGSSNEPVNSLAEEALQLRYDLRVLWHAYTHDSRPPMDLQQRLAERFGV